MYLINHKTEEELNVYALEELSKLGFDAENKGTVVRLFVHIYNSVMGEMYKTLQINHLNAFLSSAKGEFIDYIGDILNCKRQTSEKDDDYKYRISQSTNTLAKANKVSIELAALSVQGVQDVLLKPYTFGTGSFVLFAITEQAETAAEKIDEITNSINEVVSYGTKFKVETPELLMVEIGVKLIFNSLSKESDRQVAIVKSKESIALYLNSRTIGQPIVINEITERIMRVHESIVNYQLHTFRINGRDVNIVDQAPRWNQRFIESSKQGAIFSS